MASSRTSRAVAGTITSFLQYAFIILLQFLLAPVVLRIAGQEVLGAYSFLMQMISWAALTDLGFGVAIGRYLSQALGIDDDRHHFKIVFITGRTFYLFSNFAFAVIILLISWKVSSIMQMSHSVANDARISLTLLALWVAFRTPVSLYIDALNAAQNLAAVNVIRAIGSASRLLLSLGLVALGANLIGLMIANIIAEVVTLVAGYVWYCRLYPSDKFGWGIPDRRLFREMFGFGITYMVMIVAGRFSANTDSIIVGSLFGATAVSIYYTSQIPGTLLYQLIFKLTDNSVPAINELHARRATPQLANAYLRLLRYSLLLVVPLALGIFAFNRYAITLWVGNVQYAGSILTIGLAFFAITQVTIHINAILLTAFGHIRVMSIFCLCAGAAKVIFSFGLGRIVGLQGVMVANALVDIPGFIYFSYIVWRVLGLNTSQVIRQAVTPALKACSPLLLVLTAFFILPHTPTWPLFFMWIFMFVIVWLAGMCVAGILPEERIQLCIYVRRTLSIALGKTS